MFKTQALLVLASCCLIGASLCARLDIENMDYDSLISLLSENGEFGGDVQINSGGGGVGGYQKPQDVKKNRIGGGGNVELSVGVEPVFTASSILAPQVELLHLAEALLKLKGEMASRVTALINDNWELIRSVTSLLMSKASGLHSFTLVGIHVLRRILEFAIQMIGHWQLNVPSVSIDINRVFGRP